MKFCSPIRTDDEFADIPCEAEFVIEPETKHLIQRLAQLVKDNKLYKVDMFDYRVNWLDQEGEDTSTECDVLCVSEIDFWFSAYLKHTNVEILTERFRVSSLQFI